LPQGTLLKAGARQKSIGMMALLRGNVRNQFQHEFLRIGRPPFFPKRQADRTNEVVRRIRQRGKQPMIAFALRLMAGEAAEMVALVQKLAHQEQRSGFDQPVGRISAGAGEKRLEPVPGRGATAGNDPWEGEQVIDLQAGSARQWMSWPRPKGQTVVEQPLLHDVADRRWFAQRPDEEIDRPATKRAKQFVIGTVIDPHRIGWPLGAEAGERLRQNAGAGEWHGADDDLARLAPVEF